MRISQSDFGTFGGREIHGEAPTHHLHGTCNEGHRLLLALSSSHRSTADSAGSGGGLPAPLQVPAPALVLPRYWPLTWGLPIDPMSSCAEPQRFLRETGRRQ